MSVNIISSYVESDDLCWRHVKLVVNTSLEILVEQRLQLFVLLVEQACFLNEVLALHEQAVVA